MCPFSPILSVPLGVVGSALSLHLPAIMVAGLVFGTALKTAFPDSPLRGSCGLRFIFAACLLCSLVKGAIGSVCRGLAMRISVESGESDSEADDEYLCSICCDEENLARAELRAGELRARAAEVKDELGRAELEVARLLARADADRTKAELEEARAALAGLEETRAARAELEETRAALAECKAAMEAAKECA